MYTTSSNIQANNRIVWMDIAKGIGILAMYLGHIIVILDHFVYSFHMPLFFIIAGLTIKSVEKGQFLGQLYKEIKRLVLPCIIAGIIVLIGNCLIKHYSFILEAKVMVVSWIWGNHWGTFFGRSFPSVGRVWFLLALFWTRWFYRFLLRFVNDKIRLPLLLILSFFSMLMGSKGIVLPQNFDMIFVCSLFMEIGHILKKYGLSKSKSKCAVINITQTIRIDLSKFAHNDTCTSVFLALSATIWIGLSCFADIWIDMNHRRYPGYYLCILVAILGCFCVFKLSHALEKHSKICTRFLTFWGQNSIVLLVVQSIAPYFYVGQSPLQIAIDMIVELLIVVVYSWLFTAFASLLSHSKYPKK